MIFSVSNDAIQWTLDFGPESVTISRNDHVQKLTISFQERHLAAWQLLLSQRQDFLDNHLPRVAITQNHEVTMEMRDEVLSSVGAQDLDTSSYQVSDLEDIEFNWGNSQLDMNAVFRPGIDTPFSPTTIDDLSMEGSVENAIVLDEEKDKENAPPPTTPEFVRPTEPPGLQKSRAFSPRMENVPDYLSKNLFHYLLLCLCFDINNVFHFIRTFFKNHSDMCETKEVVVSISLILLVAASFCIYQPHTENKVGYYSKIKSQGPCENEYEKYCLNGGQCYYLVDGEDERCICTWFYGGKRCELYMWWD